MSRSGPATDASLCMDDTYRDQTILLTGVTGFVGKCVMEKILRSLSVVKKVIIMVRHRKGQSASERLQKEIFSSVLFDTLRKERPDFDKYAMSKVVLVEGDLTHEGMGLSPASLALIINECNVVIHCAAITLFNARVDHALELNVKGSLRLLNLVRGCKNLRVFLHVSTAYVNANKLGTNVYVNEKIYPLGFEPLEVLTRVADMSEAELDGCAMSGILREFPNTYTFTKAITERLLVEQRGNIPLVILRPSIVGASWMEPVPGWIDSISAAAAVYLACGAGMLTMLHSNDNYKADIVPVDVLVNSILVAAANTMDNNSWKVIHVATTSQKPMTWGNARKDIPRYFRSHPITGAITRKPKMSYVNDQMYQTLFFLKYSIPSSVLKTVASVTGQPGHKRLADRAEKLVWKIREMAEAFRVFVSNEWIFENKQAMEFYNNLNSSSKEEFNMEVTKLDWELYNFNFSAGLMTYCLKEDMVPVSRQTKNYHRLGSTSLQPEVSFYKSTPSLFPHSKWAMDTWAAYPTDYPVGRSLKEMHHLVLNSPAVLAAIQADALINGKGVPAAQLRAKEIVVKMFGEAHMKVQTSMAVFLRKLFSRIYTSIHLDHDGIARAQKAGARGPLIYIPTHRSYVDFLIVSYICFITKLPLPFIAAGEDFLGMLFVRWIFRKSGAFFLRRTFQDDKLYSTIFAEYVEALLKDGISLEFFIEGTRSRSGKMLQAKGGLLSIISGIFLDKKIKHLTIVPISINYEKTLEGNMYSSELMGESKVKESLRNLVAKGTSVLNMNFGDIYVGFGDTIDFDDFTERSVADPIFSAAPSKFDPISHHFKPSSSPPVIEASSSTLSSSRKAAKPSKTEPSSSSCFSSSAQTSSAAAPTTSSANTSSSAPTVSTDKFDPFTDYSHRYRYNLLLGHHVVYNLSCAMEIFPTHLVATLMLMYREGITRDELIDKVQWLWQEVKSRGGSVMKMEGEERRQIVDRAVGHLSNMVSQRRVNVYEPNAHVPDNYKHMLGLGLYRNQIVHLFYRECLYAVVLYSLCQNNSGLLEKGVEKEKVLKEVKFLASMLQREFIYKGSIGPDTDEELEYTLRSMVGRGILTIKNENTIHVAETGETSFAFLCALLWPFVDSYYVSAMVLFSLQPSRVTDEKTLLQRTQWLATTLYHKQRVCFFESCNSETLANGLNVLSAWQVIVMEKNTAKPDQFKLGQKEAGKFSVRLLAPYDQEVVLRELINRISSLRKVAPIQDNIQRLNIITEFPTLAKL